MSFINEFEERIGSIFGESPNGQTEPISFKKLAKRAAREMDREVLVSHGVETAPALYTVLVSAADDSLMRPYYPQITEETSAYLYAQAKLKGYAFVGTPLVRFMVDPGLRSGRFAVFAENVDAATLAKLRDEERAFLGLSSGSSNKPAPAPEPEEQLAEGLIPLPEDASFETAAPDMDDLDLPYEDGLDAPVEVPVTQPRAASHLSGLESLDFDDEPEPAPVKAKRPTCMFIERQSGRTYTAEGPSAIIGRERSQADIVISDPNASRVHAELTYDGNYWHITDRRSTNGTLVNDVDVTDCILRNGDIVTIGLTNLEFREL